MMAASEPVVHYSIEGLYEFGMNNAENRLITFKSWPFKDNCKCTPEKMAAAGFFHCPTEQEPDLVKCYLCLKELDGWEPTDDPWDEHKSHSPKCPFLYVKDVMELTVVEFLKLEATRQANICRKEIDRTVAEFEQQAAAAREQLVKSPWMWGAQVGATDSA